MGGVFRVYWFHKKHASMYSKVEAGLMIGFKTVPLNIGVLPDINLSPVCIEFGGTHLRGFVELACGTSYICSGGVKYAF